MVRKRKDDQIDEVIAESMRLRDQLIRTTGELSGFIARLAQEVTYLRDAGEVPDGRDADPIPAPDGDSGAKSGQNDTGASR